MKINVLNINTNLLERLLPRNAYSGKQPNNGKQYFVFSDSMYKKAFDTENEELFDFYDVGSWNIEVLKEIETIDIKTFKKYFLLLIKLLPWLTVKEIGLRNSEVKWILDENILSLKDWLEQYSDLESSKEDFVMDLGYAIFNCNATIQNIYYDGFLKSGTIYFNHDSDYLSLIFSLNINIDFFSETPSRQEGVFLSKNQIKQNRTILYESLKSIQDSKMFIIKNFTSEFYPENKSIYGFSLLEKI